MAQAGLKFPVEGWARVVNRLNDMAEVVGDDNPEVERIYRVSTRIDDIIDGQPSESQIEIVFQMDDLALVESVQPL